MQRYEAKMTVSNVQVFPVSSGRVEIAKQFVLLDLGAIQSPLVVLPLAKVNRMSGADRDVETNPVFPQAFLRRTSQARHEGNPMGEQAAPDKTIISSIDGKFRQDHEINGA